MLSYADAVQENKRLRDAIEKINIITMEAPEVSAGLYDEDQVLEMNDALVEIFQITEGVDNDE